MQRHPRTAHAGLKLGISFLDAVAEALTSLAPEQLDLDARGRHGLERCGSALFAA